MAVAPATYSGKGMEQYAITGGNVATIMSGVHLGGLHGLGQIVIVAAQLAALTANLNTAKNYYNTNKKDFDFFKANYQARLQSALNEAMTRPLYEAGIFTPEYGTLDYLASTGRGQSIAARRLDRQWFITRRGNSKYRFGLGQWIDYKFSMAKYNEAQNGWNLGFRYEDTRKQAYDETRHRHRLQILNLGVGVGNLAKAGLATSVATLNESRSQLASSLGSIGNGMAEKLMYDKTEKALKQTPTENLATMPTQSDTIFASGFGG